VHSEQVAVARALRHPRRPPDERLALRTSRERDDDPLPRFPDVVDVVLGLVPPEAFVDAVGQPEQRQLAEGGQVADAEVVAQCCIDALQRIDVAV
jgi:hypothetical protein